MTVKSEFPREETAVEYFLNPDKAALGTDSGSAHDVFELLVTDVGAAVVDTGVEEIGVITYDDSGSLAAKVSLINDIGNI
jgi:UDPglucose 6-dehydrogenase